MVRSRESFAAAIKKNRESHGLSQEELAQLAEMDRTGISRLERLAPNITLDSADALAQALGMSLLTLLGIPSLQKDSEPSKSIFAVRLREARLDAGLNQRELAERAHVDRNFVSTAESGKMNIRFETVDRFALALNVKATSLLSKTPIGKS